MEDQIWILVKKSFSNQASCQEEERLLDWLDTSSANNKLYTELRHIWETSDHLRILFG